MSGLSRRHKLLGGVLSVAAMVWVFDVIGGDPTPKEAGATQAAAGTDASVELGDVAGRAQGILEILSRPADVTLGPRRGNSVCRDLFVPEASAWRQHLTRGLRFETKSIESPEAPPSKADDKLSFAETHVFRGVVAGRSPLALIGDVIVSKGAVVDGYRVIDIQRDRVRLRGSDGFVVLVVTGFGDTASATNDEAISAGKIPVQINSLADLVDLLNSK